MVSYQLYVVGGIMVAAVALLVAFQEKLVSVYSVPVLPGPITPSRLRLGYEDVWLTSSDGFHLHARFLKIFPDCRGPTILFIQENAGNIADRLEMVGIMLQKLQCNVFMLSYRGYGASDGYPSQHGITRDAQAALEHLAQRTDIDTSRIVVFGRSLEGAVGSVLTKNNPDKVAALILENVIPSILDMAEVLLPFLKWFIRSSSSKGPRILNWGVRSWSIVDIVGQVKQPILFLSGLQDEMVLVHMKTLYVKAATHNKNCIFVEFPNGMPGGYLYWNTMRQFLEQMASWKKQNITHQIENAASGSKSVNPSSSESEASIPERMGKRGHSIQGNTASKQSKNVQQNSTTPVSSSNRGGSVALPGKATVFVPDPMTSLNRPDDYTWVYGVPVVHNHAARYKLLVEGHGHPVNARLVSEINILAQTTDNLLRVVQDIEGLGDSIPSRAVLDLWVKHLGSARLMDFSIGWLDEQLTSLENRLSLRKTVLPDEIQALEEKIVQIRAESEGYEAERKRLLEGIRSVAAKIDASQGALSAAEKSLEEKKREITALPRSLLRFFLKKTPQA